MSQGREVEPSVTVIGQIKAGKTSLLNAMIGAPGLLPTDVNPWTSVVTSLHINTPSPELNVKAKFKFFDNAEWEKLVSNGGRIGLMLKTAATGKEDEAFASAIGIACAVAPRSMPTTMAGTP